MHAFSIRRRLNAILLILSPYAPILESFSVSWKGPAGGRPDGLFDLTSGPVRPAGHGSQQRRVVRISNDPCCVHHSFRRLLFPPPVPRRHRTTLPSPPLRLGPRRRPAVRLHQSQAALARLRGGGETGARPAARSVPQARARGGARARSGDRCSAVCLGTTRCIRLHGSSEAGLSSRRAVNCSCCSGEFWR